MTNSGIVRVNRLRQGRFVLSKNFRRNNGLGSMLDLAAQMG